MLNCKINGTVHIFFLKSHISAWCPILSNFFSSADCLLYLHVIIDLGHIWGPFMAKFDINLVHAGAKPGGDWRWKMMFFFFIVCISWNFSKKISNFLKKYYYNTSVSTAKYYYMTFNFRSFPHMLGIQVCVENSQKYRFLLQMVCGNAGINFFRKPVFWQIRVFTKYHWFNATKWPQMPQKWIRTIPHWSGHTLGTLNHGLGPLYCCFITLFAAGSSLHPPGGP